MGQNCRFRIFEKNLEFQIWSICAEKLTQLGFS